MIGDERRVRTVQDPLRKFARDTGYAGQWHGLGADDICTIKPSVCRVSESGDRPEPDRCVLRLEKTLESKRRGQSVSPVGAWFWVLGERETRTELIGEWLDLEGYNSRVNTTTGSTTTELLFQNYFQLWIRFVAYWFQHSSTACMYVTTVRYEDMSDSDRNLDTICVLVNAFNSSVSSTAIERVTSTYPPSAGSTYNFYLNASFDNDNTLQVFASVCLGERALMSALGCDMFLERSFL